MEPFVHLHNHTEHSPLDGTQRQKDMVDYAADVLGQTAIAATDHGNNSGTLELARVAAERGDIKAIAGQEMYMAIGSRTEHNIEPSNVDFEGSKERRYHHLSVLVGAPEGWRNLMLLNNDAAKHFYHHPRIDFESLGRYSDGLILGTGCLGGPVASRLISGDFNGAVANTEKLLEAVKGDKDRLFVEVMRHGIPEEDAVLPGLVKIADYFGLRLVATNDAHYTKPEEAVAHDLLLATQTNRQMSDPTRFRFNGDMGAYSLKSYDEMARAFAGTPIGPKALTNTQIIADMCPDNLLSILPAHPTNGFRLPKPPVPKPVLDRYVEGQYGCSNPWQYWLYLEVRRGIEKRFGTHPDRSVLDRARYELDIINGFGVECYMLIVMLLIRAARREGFQIGAGRGSGAGSQIAYCLDITDVPPQEYNLLFERFLDVTRVGMPDFDLDFEQQALPWVVNYLRATYGDDCVAHLGTRGTKLAKAVLRDAGRLTGRPEVGAALAGTVMTKKGGKTASIKEMMDPANPDDSMRALVASDPNAAEVLRLAEPLDGIMAQPGIHACGMIISDTSLVDMIPMRKAKKTDPDSAWVVLWDGPEMESLGYLKLDRLGIRNLDIKGEAQRLIAQDFGRDLEDMRYGHISFIDEEARRAWDLLCAGRNQGIFQLDSDGMRKLMLGEQPRSLEDISALLALYRPGPMGAKMHERFVARRQGSEAVTYDYLTEDPNEQREIAKILDSTMGIICVAKGEKVYSASRRAMVPIEQIQVGEYVQGVDAHGQHRVAPVSAAWMSARDAEVVTVRLAGHHSITVTPNHRIYTTRGWVEARHLRDDDYVSIVPELLDAPAWSNEEPGDTQRVAEAQLLGYLLGDGGLTTRNTPIFTKNDPAMQEAFAQALSTVFPGHTTASVGGQRAVTSFVLTNTPMGGAGGTKPSPQLQWLRRLGLKRADGSGVDSRAKFVPEEFKRAPLNVVAALVAAMWDCDGRVRSQMGNNRGMSYKTVSKRLADDVTFLLLRLGVQSTLTTNTYSTKVKGDGVAYHISVKRPDLLASLLSPYMRHPQKKSACEDFAATGPIRLESEGTRLPWSVFTAALEADGLTLLEASQRIGHTRALRPRQYVGGMLLRRIAEEFATPEITRLAHSRWVPVMSVDASGTSDVYDLTVPELESFTGNYVTLHNCYQEQVMELSARVAGFGPGLKNRLRKTISKKKPAEMAAMESLFMAGAAVATTEGGFIEGVTPEGDTTSASIAFRESTARELWRTFTASADYLFNKCIDGRTTLLTGRGVGPNAETWTVEDLYHRLHGNPDAPTGMCPHCGERPTAPRGGPCRRCKSWLFKFRDERGFSVLALDEADGRIRPARVADVHANGEREVFRVELADGRVVRSTGNHRWLTPTGYRTVDDLRVGDELVVHAGYERKGRWSKGHLAATSAIVSITPDGVDEVYDVEMAEGTDHNFVANGVISHNSHSVAYGMLTYQTAWLKANYPTHYSAALLSKTEDDKRFIVLNALRGDGIEVVGPDINTGSAHTTVVGKHTIALGLGEIKGVKSNIGPFIAEREANGPFTSLLDVVRRVKVQDPKTGKWGKVSVGVYEALIEAGAFDSLHHGPNGETQRAGMMMAVRALATSLAPILPVEWPAWEKAEREHERLGLLISEHPLTTMGREAYYYAKELIPRNLEPAGLGELDVDDRRWVVAKVASFSVSPMKSRPGKIARFTLEGSHVSLNGVMFDSDLERQIPHGGLPQVGDFVVANVQAQHAYVRPVADDNSDNDGVDYHDGPDDDDDIGLDAPVAEEPSGIELIANRFLALPLKPQDPLWVDQSPIRLARTLRLPSTIEADLALGSPPAHDPLPHHVSQNHEQPQEQESQQPEQPTQQESEQPQLFHDVPVKISWLPTNAAAWISLRQKSQTHIALATKNNVALVKELTAGIKRWHRDQPDTPWEHPGLGVDEEGRPYRLISVAVSYD